jgi:hypothetical protein
LKPARTEWFHSSVLGTSRIIPCCRVHTCARDETGGG